MRILKKMCFIFFIAFLISILSCNRCPSEPEKSIRLVGIHEIKQEYTGFNTIAYNIGYDSIAQKGSYRGFHLTYSIEYLALQELEYNNKPFSFFPSAYAWSSYCPTSVNLKKSYPVSFVIKTKHTFNSQSSEGSIINEYFEIPFATLDSKKTQIDTIALQKEVFNIQVELSFYLKILNSNSIQNDSLQFDIETILNTGDTLIVRTPLILFK